MVETIAGEEADEQLFAEVLWLREHPLDLNAATEDELLRIPGITSADVEHLLAVRVRIGSFRSVEHVRRLRDGGRHLYDLLAPFVVVEPPDETIVQLRSRFTRQTPWEEAGAWPGPPAKEFHRLEITLPGAITGGCAFARDPGERYRDASLTGHAVIPQLIPSMSVLLGDFALLSGCGLVLGTAAGTGIGVAGRSAPCGEPAWLKPFSGSPGARMLRGCAVEHRWRRPGGDLSSLLFISRIPLSASLNEAGEVATVKEDDRFDSESALLSRHTLSELTLGGHVGWKGLKHYSVGWTFMLSKYSRPLRMGGGARGLESRAWFMGMDMRVGVGHMLCAGEIARSGHDWAFVVDFRVSLPSGFAVGTVVQHFASDFVNPRAIAWGTGGEPTNCDRVRLTCALPLNDDIALSGYLGWYRRPWRTFFDRMPPEGSERAVAVELGPFAGCTLGLQYAGRLSEATEQSTGPGDLKNTIMAPRLRERISCAFRIRPSRRLTVGTRVQLCISGETLAAASQRGWLLSQDITWTPHTTFRVSARVGLFQTASYESRLYAMESDLEGVYANPPLYGTGGRWYVLSRWDMFEGATFSVKFGQSVSAVNAAVPLHDQVFSAQLDLRPVGP